jgi:uncharacterized membrane protein
MVNLTEEETAAINAAIAAAEAESAITVKAILAPASCRYTGWVAICAFITALLTSILSLFFIAGLTPTRLMLIELGTLLGTSLLYEIPWIKLLIVPNRIEKQAVWRQARLHFADIKIRAATDNPLLLFYCSHAEHYAEILVDERIGARVPNEVWQTILDGFRPHMRRRDIGAAFLHVVEQSRSVLQEHFRRD